MPQEDAGLQLWIAAERYDREKRELELERAPILRHGSETPSLRQRAGMAMIRLGEKLAGEARPRRARRLAARPS
jgi:hypothetical protein